MRAGTRTALASLLVLVAWAGPRFAAASGGDGSAEERRCVELSEMLDRLAAECRARADADTLAVLEAEEIARVADEILAEGDADLARDLFEEALALLAPEPADR